MAGGPRHRLLPQTLTHLGTRVALLVGLSVVAFPTLAFAQAYGDGNYSAGQYGAPIIYGESSGGQPSSSSGGGGGSISVPVTTPSSPSSTGTTGGSSTTTPVATSTPTTATSTPTSPGAPSSVVSAPILSRTLSLGDEGSDVQALQQYLKSVGYLSVDQTTAYFGALTSAAVQKYQCDRGIVCRGTPDTTGWGSVGPLTLAAFAGASIGTSPGAGTGTTTPQAPQTPPVQTESSPSSFSFTRILYRGMSGDDVSAAQSILVRLGYLAADLTTGYFGQLTWKAVMQLQCDKSVVCSGDESATGWGIIGPKTAEILDSL